jgi:hypothetical protein
MSTRTATSSQSKNNVSFNRKPGGYLNYDSEESLYDLRDVSRAIVEKGVGSLMQTDPISLAIPERTAYHPHFVDTAPMINFYSLNRWYIPYLPLSSDLSYLPLSDTVTFYDLTKQGRNRIRFA